MDRRILLFFIVLSGFLIPGGIIVLVFPYYFTAPHYHTEMYGTYYTFQLWILPSELIRNATFYIPLPVYNGSPMVGPRTLDSSLLEQPNISVELSNHPPDMPLFGTSALPGNDPVYMKISMAELDPDTSVLFTVRHEVENASHPAFTETRYPFGNQSVILPKLNFSFREPQLWEQDNLMVLHTDSSELSQQTMIYADYPGSSTTWVLIDFSYNVANSWTEPGAGPHWGNFYSDTFRWKHTGSSHGWYPVNGTFRAGSGTYPNTSHPGWAQVLNYQEEK